MKCTIVSLKFKKLRREYFRHQNIFWIILRIKLLWNYIFEQFEIQGDPKYCKPGSQPRNRYRNFSLSSHKRKANAAAPYKWGCIGTGTLLFTLVAAFWKLAVVQWTSTEVSRFFRYDVTQKNEDLSFRSCLKDPGEYTCMIIVREPTLVEIRCQVYDYNNGKWE